MNSAETPHCGKNRTCKGQAPEQWNDTIFRACPLQLRKSTNSNRYRQPVTTEIRGDSHE